MFRAYDATRERLVAVKLFKLDLPPERSHQLVAEFERLIAADLAHPALAAPLATGISGVSAYLAQDYVAADSLDLAVREYGPAPAGSALRVAAQLAGALDFAAAVQITHGALHPRDVLLSSDDTRLIGLGITRALERIGVVAPVRRPYTAPERIAGGDWDRRADVFSLAALIHELMWGRRVSGLGTRAAEHLTAIPGADLEAVRSVFARALAEDPAARFDTALGFAEALRDACPDVTIEPEPTPAPKRRATAREIEPRLPLDETAEAPVASAPARDAASGERRSKRRNAQVLTPEAEAAMAPTVVEPEAAPVAAPVEPDLVGSPGEFDLVIAPIAEPEIAYQVAAPIVSEPAQEPRAPIPAGLIAGSDPAIFSALERTRSAVWPLVLALGVGIAIGFAGGFFAGSQSAPAAPVSPAAVTAGHEFTEAAVPSPKVDVPSPKAEGEVAKAEPVKTPPVNPQAQTLDGRLFVRTRPAGARLSVDGKDYGTTPAAVRDLATGAHRVKITRDGFATEERRVTITSSHPSQTMTVPLARAAAAAPPRRAAEAAASAARFVGALVVDSRPAGAKVFVDGKLVGATPMSLPSVAAGSHAIRLEHDGYQHWSSSVRVVASEQNRVTASLER